MDQERRKWWLYMQEMARCDITKAIERLSHPEWRENDPGAQASLDSSKANERFCEVTIRYGDDVFNYFDSVEGQYMVRETIRAYQAMRVYTNEEELGIDCEDSIVFLLGLLHE